MAAAAEGAAATVAATVKEVLVGAVTDGYLIGAVSAVALVEQTSADWEGWTPGDTDAAAKILGDNGLGAGLQAMLAASRVRLTGVTEDRMEEFARVLAAGVARGDSVDTLAAHLRRFLTNPSWAYVVAQQEMARAVSAATLDTYEDNGIAQHRWLVAGEDPSGAVHVCPKCQRNGAAGAVDVGEEFPTGDIHPPAHPRCRCALTPVLDMDGLDEFMDDDEESADAVDVAEARYVRTAAGAKQYGQPVATPNDDDAGETAAAVAGFLAVAEWLTDTGLGYIDEAGDLWVWDALEARYVRTPAGAKRYGLPVGSLIRPRRNRDGFHDPDQQARRRAYYARARDRAQARHAARMENSTADGYRPKAGDWLIRNGSARRVRTAPVGGKVDVGWDGEYMLDVKSFQRGGATRAKPLPADLNRNELSVARAVFGGPDDGATVGRDGQLAVTDLPRAVARLDEYREGSLAPSRDRTVLSLQARLVAMVNNPAAGKRSPKPDPTPKPTPKPVDDGDDGDDGGRAERLAALRQATVTTAPAKGGKIRYTVALPDGTVIGTRTSANDYGAVRVMPLRDGTLLMTFHRTPELAARGNSEHRKLPHHVITVADHDDDTPATTPPSPAPADTSTGGAGGGERGRARTDAERDAETAARERRVAAAIPELQKALTEIGPGGVRDRLAELYPNADDRDLDATRNQVVKSLTDWGTPTPGMSEHGRGARLAVRALDRQQGAGNHLAEVDAARARLGEFRLFGLASKNNPDGPRKLDVDGEGRVTAAVRADLDTVRDAGAALAAEVARRTGQDRRDLAALDATRNKLDADRVAAAAEARTAIRDAWKDRFRSAIPVTLYTRIGLSNPEVDPGGFLARSFPPDQIEFFNSAVAAQRGPLDRVRAARDQLDILDGVLRSRQATAAVRAAEVRREVLAEVRPMGRGDGEPVFRPGSQRMSAKKRAELTQMLAWSADDAFPSEWQDQARVVHRYGVEAKSARKRAYYSPSENLIDVGTNPSGDVRMWRAVTTHEATHSYESTRPWLKAAELAYLRARIERTEPLPRGRYVDHTSTIYQGTKEIGYKDDFPSHYTGKVYGVDGLHMPFEILSTSFETLLGGGREYTDADMEHFALGVLALL